MDIKDILSKVDHTLLNPKATWEEIKNICDDGMKYCTASVCIPPKSSQSDRMDSQSKA